MARACPLTKALLVLLVVRLAAAPDPAWPAQGRVGVSRAHIVARYPHDVHAFTQGLLYYNGYLYESTGLHGRSSVRRVAVGSGRVLARSAVPAEFFGEGLARVGNRLFQLTWQAGVAFVYALPGLRRIGRRHYRGQGWGLTWDGRHLIMSDGSSILRFVDPDTFAVERRLQVTRAGRPVDRLNELEYFCGAIWANVRYADSIVRIDPRSGSVTAVLDASPLRRALPAPDAAGVLNGIAWDEQGRRLFVTGKNWPLVFAIRPPQCARQER